MKATERKQGSRIPPQAEASTMATAKRSSEDATQVTGSPGNTAHLGRYARLVRALGHTRAFAWLGVHLFTRLDKRLFSLTRGAFNASATASLPVVFLTTLGRRTGEPRTTPLLYLTEGERLVVVGSNFGQRRHPAWSENLLAHPEATVQFGRRRQAVAARLASAEEKARLWPRLVRMWPALQAYGERSGRDFRVFILTPRAARPAPQTGRDERR